jgi:hypothetical protein
MSSHVENEEGHSERIATVFTGEVRNFSMRKTPEDLQICIPSTMLKKEPRRFFAEGLKLELADKLPTILENFRQALHQGSPENGHSPIES